MWDENELVKAVDYDIRWYRKDDINILTSEGDMRRVAVDAWVAMVREIIASKAEDETLFMMFDLTGPKQGTTPYSMKVTRDMALDVANNRLGKTFVAVLMKNPLLVGFIQAFFHQHFASQKKLIYRLFTDDTLAVAWIQEQSQQNKSDV